jgi:hypothetical protein
MLLATAYEGDALRRACEHHVDAQALARHGIAATDRGIYEMNFTATALEVSRTPANRRWRQPAGERGPARVGAYRFGSGEGLGLGPMP